MDTRLDDYLLADHSVEQRVRKAGEEDPPNVAAYDWGREGIRRDEFHGGVYGRAERRSETLLAILVPLVGCIDIRVCGRTKDDKQRDLLEPLANL